MPLKSIPQLGDSNWGTPLNAHLAQLQNPTNGGINTFEQFSGRLTNLTADDTGKTYLYTQTGNLHQWTGTTWKVLNESVINVKDYGAIGDGVVDDTVAVQNVINKRGAIFIPAGRYLTTSTLFAASSDTSSTKIYGDGRGKTILDFAPSSFNTYNDTAIWVGNHVDNTPTTIYETQGFKLTDMSIYVNGNARVGLRLRETMWTNIKNVFVGAENFANLTNCTGLMKTPRRRAARYHLTLQALQTSQLRHLLRFFCNLFCDFYLDF
jgi:Pectate lyase superfamily protein